MCRKSRTLSTEAKCELPWKWINKRSSLLLAPKVPFNDTVCKLFKKRCSSHGVYRKIIDFLRVDKKYLFFPPLRNPFLFVFGKRSHKIIANGLDSGFALR